MSLGPAEPAGVPAVQPAAPLRVVVADDHPIWRDAVERDLAAAGLRWSASRATARRRCGSARPRRRTCWSATSRCRA
jgi:hypothetical protein